MLPNVEIVVSYPPLRLFSLGVVGFKSKEVTKLEVKMKSRLKSLFLFLFVFVFFFFFSKGVHLKTKKITRGEERKSSIVNFGTEGMRRQPSFKS